VEDSQGAAGKNEATAEGLFAALLHALGSGLIAPEGQVLGGAAMQTAQHSAEGDIVAGGIEAIASATALPEQASAVSAEHGGAAGNLLLAEASPSGTPETVPVTGAVNEATDGTPSPQPQPAQSGNACDPNVLTTVHDPEVSAEFESSAKPGASWLPPQASAKLEFFAKPGASWLPPQASAEFESSAKPGASWLPPEASAEFEFFAGPGARPQPPESGAQVNALPEAEQLSPMPEGGSGSVAGAADAKTLASTEKAANLQGEVQPAESAPTELAHMRAQTKPVSTERVPTGTQHATQQDGDEFARGPGERSLPESIVHAHEIRTQHIVNTTDSNFTRISDVGKAQLTQSVIDQTVKSVLLSVRNGSSVLRVRLKPDHLGELHLRLVFKDNVLHLDVNTQSTVVKGIIESNLSQLRQSLDNSGFDTGRLSITVDSDLPSGGQSSRQANAFEPSENDWNGTYPGRHADEEPSQEAVYRSARMRYAVGQIDLIA
jgi:hypothetical protein